MRVLADERGGTHIIVFGLVWAAIIFSVIFFDFYTVFITKRIGQTGADAAALAAADEARAVYEKRLEWEVNRESAVLSSIVHSEAAALAASLRISFQEAWDMVIAKRSIPPGLETKLKDLSKTVDATEALTYFYGPFYKNDLGKITSMMCESIESAASVRQIASRFAEKNGADKNVKLEFPHRINGENKFEVYIQTKKTTSFASVASNRFAPGDMDVYAEAAAAIKIPNGIVYDPRRCH